MPTFTYTPTSCAPSLNEQVTFTGVGATDPNTLFSYDSGTRDLTILSTTDISTAGTYTISLKVTNPNDATNFRT